MNGRMLVLSALAVIVSGCASYHWKPTVPERYRTVSVPVFRDESGLTETGSVVARQILRELQREGTFRLCGEDAAVEVQGTIKAATPGSVNVNYKNGSRLFGGTMRVTAVVSVIDRIGGRVLVNNRVYVGEAEFSSGQDRTTALRDASGRAADDMAKKVVDDLVAMKWDSGKENKQ